MNRKKITVNDLFDLWCDLKRGVKDNSLQNCKYRKKDDPVLLPPFGCRSLRHTFTTRLCEEGVNIKVIQDILGHKDISTTLDIYTDVTKDLKKKEITSFENSFSDMAI